MIILKGEKPQPQHLIFGVFLVLYILLNVQTPEMIATSVDNVYGKLFLAALVLLIFMQSHPVIGILSGIAAYFLIKRSTVTTGNYALEHYLPSEQVKLMDYAKYNEFDATLEEEVVSKMAPLVTYDAPANVDYKPVLDAQFDAAPIDYDGVI